MQCNEKGQWNENEERGLKSAHCTFACRTPHREVNSLRLRGYKCDQKQLRLLAVI